MTKFQIYSDRTGMYRWRLISDNGRIIADSAEGYHNFGDCEHGIMLVKNQAPNAIIERAV